MIERLRRLARDWFLAGMVSAVVLATLLPELGRSGGPLHADRVANAGIFGIFFFHGLALSRDRLRAGMMRWRLHAVVQAMTYVAFPIVGLVLAAAFGRFLPEDLLLGFFYLCALPSTISSSVAMTAVAHGNVPGAIFNATLSSLIGIIATPLLVSVWASTSGESLSLGRAVLDIATLLLLPIVLGQLLRPALGAWFQRWHRHASTFDKLVILLLVYVSFSDSVRAGLWTKHGVSVLAIAVAGAALILAVVLTLSTRLARLVGLDKEDEIAAVFCGSKKTLASGVPMAKLIFGAHPGLGLIVLPIMFYHQLQLFVGSILAERYARRLQGAPSPAPAAAHE
ncbi:bile acid:sodium symporter family protein [Anaeromyxobacter sp. SG26]|uniref:bile acid:sodium symporter family protein n=1 Tax=Anaeromyxobacter sp. SG26 TaxID=2925407 RepID=UPI001F58B300|nr:bile acid:sodium symporter family protein [Anaeromyxobacter sp. SG26]